MRFSLCLIIILMLAPGLAQAAPCSIAQAREVGHGRARVMFLPVYEATLYAPHGAWNKNKPFVLKLHYLHAFKGGDIVARSVSEMRQTGFKDSKKLEKWRAKMEGIFPDVNKGSVLMGLYTPGGATVFCDNKRKIGSVDDPAFGPTFFDIWLSPSTSDPHLRSQLLGLGS